MYYLKKTRGKGQTHSSIHLPISQKHLQRMEILQLVLPHNYLRHYEFVFQRGERGGAALVRWRDLPKS